MEQQLHDETQRAIDDGAAAERLLASEDYQKAVRMTQNRLMLEWAQTEPHQHLRRERLYMQMRALQNVDLTLAITANAGVQAEGVLARIRQAIRRGVSSFTP